jgi:uncharacterized protein (TIGR02001 family)
MKTWKLALAAAAASLAMGATAARADDAPSVSFNLGASSDYVFRGVSQTDGDPQVFGGADLTSGIFYAGVWASNVDFGDDTKAEVDGYFGVKPTAGPVSLDIGAVYYGYVNAPSGSDYGYWEVKAAGSVPAGPVTLGAALYYSPEFFGGVGDALYYEANASGSPADKWTVSGAIGHQSINDFSALDYTTWNLGVSYAFTDKISGDLRYHDSDIDFCTAICDSRVVVSLKATLP